MEITSISKYKGSTYEVELDGERKLYLHIDIIADNGLRKGTQLEKDELRKIIYDSNFRRAYQYALYCLDYRDYSARDMLSKLVGTYKNETLCRAVLKKLTGAGIIDDARYAEKLARRLVEARKYGFRRAKRELLMKRKLLLTPLSSTGKCSGKTSQSCCGRSIIGSSLTAATERISKKLKALSCVTATASMR